MCNRSGRDNSRGNPQALLEADTLGNVSQRSQRSGRRATTGEELAVRTISRRVAASILRCNVHVFLIWVRISLAATHNPNNCPFVLECAAGRVLVQANLVDVFSLTRKTEAG
jgi:hypothetical protein